MESIESLLRAALVREEAVKKRNQNKRERKKKQFDPIIELKEKANKRKLEAAKTPAENNETWNSLASSPKAIHQTTAKIQKSIEKIQNVVEEVQEVAAVVKEAAEEIHEVQEDLEDTIKSLVQENIDESILDGPDFEAAIRKSVRFTENEKSFDGSGNALSASLLQEKDYQWVLDASQASFTEIVYPNIQLIRPFVLPTFTNFINNDKPKFINKPDDSAIEAYEQDLVLGLAPSKLMPRIFGCFLLGDDFFLETCLSELDCGLDPRIENRECGLCISGLTLKEAYERLEIKNFPPGTIIIMNIGSIDILYGSQDSLGLIDEFYDLLVLCDQLNYILIATTLAPITNLTNELQRKNLITFNKFLRKMPYCIDIYASLVTDSGIINYEYFEQEEKDVTGFEQKRSLHLWNHLGKHRVVNAIRTKLGEITAKR